MICVRVPLSSLLVPSHLNIWFGHHKVLFHNTGWHCFSYVLVVSHYATKRFTNVIPDGHKNWFNAITCRYILHKELINKLFSIWSSMCHSTKIFLEMSFWWKTQTSLWISIDYMSILSLHSVHMLNLFYIY